MKVLVTGSDGFVGKNLALRLAETDGLTMIPFTRSTEREALPELAQQADAIVHLAGENRPADPGDFEQVNVGLTQALVDAASASGNAPPILFASSIQADNDSPYGQSKRGGEKAVEAYASGAGRAATIYRFPNIFGKWARPNYNSAVATFAYNASQGLPLPVNHPGARLQLIYIDDVVDEILDWLGRAGAMEQGVSWGEAGPVYQTTVGEVAEKMESYAKIPGTLTVDSVGTGLSRALYATYVSYLDAENVSYDLTVHADPRGRFAEMLRTEGSGQVSFFTAGPSVTRGGHYHHTKTEKFLIVQGRALFKFRNMATGESFEIETDGDHPKVVDTIPGWAHDITNVGDNEMIVVLWANELFDRDRPDTIAEPLG